MSSVLLSGSSRVLASCIRGGAVRRKVWWKGTNYNPVPTICSLQLQWMHSQAEGEDLSEPEKIVHDITIDSVDEPWTFGTQPATHELRLYYQGRFPDIVMDNDTLFTRQNRFDKNGKSWWTATFTCPVTGRTYQAGTLETLEPRMHVDDTVYYARVRHALQAAAARAVDGIRYEQQNISTPRCCLEDPSETSRKTDVLLSSPLGPNEVEVFDLEEDQDEEESSDEEEEMLPTKKKLGFTTYVDTPDIDDYTIQHVTSSGALSTMDRLLRAWTQDVSSIAVPPTEENHSTLPLPSDWNPIEKRRATIEAARAWFKTARGPKTLSEKPWRRSRRRKRSKEGPQFYTPTPLTLEAGNSILAALASANQETFDTGSEATKESVESLAKEIVGLLWERAEQGATPNADTYNLLMQCFSGTHEEMARQADDLCKQMASGQVTVHGDMLLPKPNVETYNTVIQLWGRVGGQVNKDNVNKIYNILVNDTEGHGLLPNRNTFLSVLASMTSGSDGDVDAGPTWFQTRAPEKFIKRAQELAEMLQDDTLRPDTVMYNAPLRRSSSGVAKWSRSIPWDRHDWIFSKGFKPSEQDGDDKLTTEAKKMEDWLQDMEAREGVDPNIETYESVIQAWIRTGTLDGVLQAESLAIKLIASSSTISPRLGTFHPILAAWVFSGDERGPAKVEEWIQRLEDLSMTTPHLKPDGRIKALVVKAWRMRVERLGEKSFKDKVEKSDAVESAARSCSRALEQLCDDLRQTRLQGSEPNFFLEGSVFEDATRAWGKVAWVVKPSDDVEEGQQKGLVQNDAIAQIFHTLQHLDATIEFYTFLENNPTDQGTAGRMNASGTWHSRQLQHLLHSAPKLNASLVAIFNGYKRLDKEGLFARYLPWVETRLRRSGEYYSLLHGDVSDSPGVDDPSSVSSSRALQSHQDNDSIVTYSDLYRYSRWYAGNKTDNVPGPLVFFKQIVIGCKSLSPDYEAGDAIRLCMFILDFLTTYSMTLGDVDATDVVHRVVLVVGSKVTNAKKRAAIMEQVRNRVHSLEGTDKEKESRTDNEDDTSARDDAAAPTPRKLFVNKGAILSQIDKFLEDKKSAKTGTSSRRPARRSGGKTRRRGRVKKHQKKKSA